MKPCSRVGVEVTWRCQWRCATCFYLRNPNFHHQIDVPLADVRAKIKRAHDNGLDHVVMVGYGEPSLCPNTPAILEFSQALGMATSMITNGCAGLDRYKGYFQQGIDHLHLSSHGLNGTLDEISHFPGAFAKQAELKAWMKSEGLPFRTNVTLQNRNYRELPELAAYECEMGVYHFVFLGFLPHYEWHNHVADVAVHPGELRPYIEEAAEVLLAHNRLFTIRYHPLCHLSPKYWKYVVNARYVAFDPWEWNYSLQIHDHAALWRDSVECGESVANHSPCLQCAAYRHCGGWNKVYAAAFPGCLAPIHNIPDEYQEAWEQDGGLHDMNPANACTGTIRSTPTPLPDTQGR